MKYLVIPILLFSIVFYTACDNTTEDFIVDYGYNYVPLEIGKYITYDVDSISYSSEVGGGTLVINGNFEWRETVVDTFRDGQNRLTYEIERERRDSATQDWQLVHLLVANQVDNRLEVVENNRRFVKMYYPLAQDDTLSLTRYFDELELISVQGEVLEAFKGWEYQVETLNVPETINGFDFDSTTIISYADTENAIELRSVKEQYARNVGLIYREMFILDTQCLEACAGQAWEEKAEKGFILRCTIKDYN